MSEVEFYPEDTELEFYNVNTGEVLHRRAGAAEVFWQVPYTDVDVTLFEYVRAVLAGDVRRGWWRWRRKVRVYATQDPVAARLLVAGKVVADYREHTACMGNILVNLPSPTVILFRDTTDE